MQASRVLSGHLWLTLLFAKYGNIYGLARDSRSTTASYGQRERWREAVQSFAVQPSLLRRVREPNLDFGGTQRLLSASLALSIVSSPTAMSPFLSRLGTTAGDYSVSVPRSHLQYVPNLDIII